ncbi:MAG TPA: chromosome segregation protein SMC [Pyrinomonadaceae bacterium]|nr:chromosome segregation protein SMC [Pyrinomonadaceae bacterium]
MFRLQRIELTGFKSFADYTELLFTGAGITAVVGPNGCGKSNVADAIAWVLGEQRAKSLRGAEMKDVIFQGSRNRPPSGMAEVVLHMVRDERAEEESDIEDIDSALEEIDDQAEAVEERLAPEVTDASAAAPAQLTSGDSANVAPEAVANAEPLADGASASVTSPAPSAPLALAAGDVVEGEPASSAAITPDAQAGSETAVARARHKRHWRPRRRAFDFAPGETVTVTRRLYRSGESEYLLNGRICRLRDIQDLFSGTGLAGAHYAIIEQGRIGQILSAKPMDRRTLIEEAAGITKFRVRQRAAEARLDAARSNLNRVSDIISEIEKQVNSLRRQAAKARRYSQMRDELRELLRRVYVADERALVRSLDDLQARLASATAGEQALVVEVEEREDEARRATGFARQREEELAEARAAVADAALQRDRRERERAYQGEQAASLERRAGDLRQEIERVRLRAAEVEGECETLRGADVQQREETDEAGRLLAEVEAAYAARVAEVLEAELSIERARTELLTHTAVAERLMEIGRQLDASLERLAEQAEGLEREGERARAAHEAARAEAATLQEEITEARRRLEEWMEERETAALSVAEARTVVATTAEEHARARDEAARVRHRLDTLKELDAQHALYSQAVRRIFAPDAEGSTPRGFHSVGTLADVLRVEPQWERAVEAVLGPVLQTVIVPTPDDALRAAAWLQESGAGRATFLVAGLHGASVDDEAAESASSVGEAGLNGEAAKMSAPRIAELLGATPEIVSVLERTLPRELNARVAAGLEEAVMRSLETGDVYATLDGEWVSGGQLIGAGGTVASGEGTGLLAFKREIRELEARRTELEAELLTTGQAAERARARLSELEDTLLQLNDQIGREEREHVARELNMTRLGQDIERAERHMRVVADDAARLSEERRQLKERRARQSAEAEAAEAARLAATQEVAAASEVLAAARRAAEAESERLGKQRAAAATAAERRRSTAAELRRMEAESNELLARLARHESEVSETEARLGELRRAMEEIEQTAERVESERATRQRAVEEATERLAEARERADALAYELTELHQRAASMRDARAALEVQRAETAARLNYVRESCAAELSQSLEELAAQTTEEDFAGFDLEASRVRVEELRARLESFGAVNMMALEELAESEERLDFLTTQRKDITDGILSTEEALREIKRRSRERFRHAFESVNHNFGQFFLELFGGGRGEMSLIDADDVLESGIDIIAQPPGKRLQNVLLLSGGEKAMAALALVLAIFRYRPSPFCLLDEVDAPLDEANIGRFANKITEMSADTQFIVITHNKRTMESARALYGVTMEEAGVSKLVSVRFD